MRLPTQLCVAQLLALTIGDSHSLAHAGRQDL
jgi:hypothetical protein